MHPHRRTFKARRVGIPWLVALGFALPNSVGTAVFAQSAPQNIANGTFDDGTSNPWWTAGIDAAQVVDGRLCLDVTGGTENLWDVLLGQNGVRLEPGQAYSFQFDATADQPANFVATVQLGQEPYTSALYRVVTAAAEPSTYRFDFTSNLQTQDGQVTFQLGGGVEDFTLCLDNISLTGGAPYVPETGPRVRVNQVGYVPSGPKRATWVTDATEPQPWQLERADGVIVSSGRTRVFGVDAPSGDHVHEIDFSGYHRSGHGYKLVVGSESSYPFDIENGLYDRLRYDAVAFFYPMRSGVPIEAKYAGDLYARPAGHVGVLPNQGDTNVPCVDGTCDYTLDVRGGWYDAGDEGKYVVNGGIAVWQLVNTYERAFPFGLWALRDGTQRIPERANGIPDILDEARWELEFMLRMQVPDGKPQAGMAFHRIHDNVWTPIPTRPDQDAAARFLHPPSTAATLDLAAAAAQSSRVWRQWDRAFAERCLVAAEKAWRAALANPAVYTSPAQAGGGEYGDTNVLDEFYWAAAELFITTGKKEYRDFVTASPYYRGRGIPSDGFIWNQVSALGDLSLATVPSRLSFHEVSELRKAIAQAADRVIDTLYGQGYPVPFRPAGDQYYWGSNGQVLNQIALLGAAYDATWNWKYRDAAFEAMDYLLGRNGLNQSYVTGYGSKASENQHHRFWAHQIDPTYPHPPAGAVAGGPDAALEDPVAAGRLAGCSPQKCYLDDIQSYSTNEVAINWNSALAWVAAWLADHS